MDNVPAGTQDLFGTSLEIRQKIFDIAKQCFLMRGAEELETPVFEYMNNVDKLYGGEFDKLVFKLNDNDDKYFLRYDLTVPFMRYASMHGLKLFRRFQISRVYRKDTPQLNKGRMREFYQCDFDILGDDMGSNVFDIEILDVTVDILSRLLGKSNFILRFNTRKIIQSIITHSGISDDNIKTTVIILDKLDKITLEDAEKELQQKGINDDQIKKLKTVINDILSISNLELLTYLESTNIIDKNEIEYIRLLMNYFENIGFTNYVFSPLLARGMDYYTGVIFECFSTDSNVTSSIAGGGRYDNMYGKLSNLGDVPAIGMSIGVERIARIIEKNFSSNKIKYNVYIASIGVEGFMKKMKLASLLRKNNISVALSYIPNQKMRHQFDFIFDNKISLMIVIGENEVNTNTVTIKNINTKEQKSIPDDNIMDCVFELLG